MSDQQHVLNKVRRDLLVNLTDDWCYSLAIAGIARTWLSKFGVQAAAKDIVNAVITQMLEANEIAVGTLDEKTGFIADQGLSDDFESKTNGFWDETGMTITPEGGFWIDATEKGRELGQTLVQDFNEDHPELPGSMG